MKKKLLQISFVTLLFILINIIIGVSIKPEYNTLIVRLISGLLVLTLFIVVYFYDRIDLVEFIPIQGSRIIVTAFDHKIEQMHGKNIHTSKIWQKGLVKDVYYDGSFILDTGSTFLHIKNDYEFMYETGSECFCPACGNETQTVPKNPFTLDTLQSEKCKKCKTELVSARDKNGNYIWQNYKYYKQQTSDLGVKIG